MSGEVGRASGSSHSMAAIANMTDVGVKSRQKGTLIASVENLADLERAGRYATDAATGRREFLRVM